MNFLHTQRIFKETFTLEELGTPMVKEFEKICIEIGRIDPMNMSSSDVVRNNTLADKLNAIANRIGRSDAESQDFLKLLSHENITVRLWTAHSIVERMSYDKSVKDRALEVIRQVAESDWPIAWCEEMWLEDYNKTTK